MEKEVEILGPWFAICGSRVNAAKDPFHAAHACGSTIFLRENVHAQSGNHAFFQQGFPLQFTHMEHDKNQMRRTWAALISELGDAVFAKWNTAGARIFKNDRLPTLDEASRAARATVAEAAVSACSGNKTRAAQMLGVSKPTIQAALKGFEVGDPPDLWENLPMGAFDDSLFPFIRTRWDADPTIEFIEQYRDWALGTILPRCAAEDTKVVVLEDCSAWTSLPSLTILNKLVAVTQDTDALVKQHTLGIIGFMPNMNWVTWLNPILAITAIPHRFANDPDQALDFANELFTTGSVAPPENMSIA